MSQDALDTIQKRIFITQCFAGLANTALGLGLYGIFAAHGNAFISVLNSKEFCYSLVIFGIIFSIFTITKLMRLWKEKDNLQNNL